MKKTFLIFTYFIYSLSYAGASDCSNVAGGTLQTLWMTTGVNSLKMQNIQLSPFLAEIDKLQKQKGGDQGKTKSLYECTMIEKGPDAQNSGLFALLFTLKSSAVVEARLDLPNHIRLVQVIPAQDSSGYRPPSTSCYQVIYKVNGSQAKNVGYLTVNNSTSWPEAVKNCNVLNDRDNNS